MFTREPYLTLNEAMEIARDNARTWDGEIANREGWAIFNLPDGDNPGPNLFLDAGIEGYFELDQFEGCERTESWWPEGDEAVVDHCKARAAEGSIYHAQALTIEHALNSIRYHVWGEDWVDSRMGPDA